MKDLNLEALSSYESRRKSQARARLDALAKQLGYSLAELFEVGVRAQRAPSVARYRNPDNENVTWSGRGRQPKWFVDHIAAGKDPMLLAI